MIPQTFRGRSIEEARRNAETSLGDSAVLVQARRVPRPGVLGWFGAEDVELTMSPSAPPPPKPGPRPFFSFTNDADRGPIETIRSELKNEVRSLRSLISQRLDSSTDDAQKRLRTEIADLKEQIELLTVHADAGGSNILSRRIRALGIEGATAKALAKAAKNIEGPGIEAALNTALRSIVRQGNWPVCSKGRTLISLLGATGVGKTTTAAKLAARAIIEHERTVTLVTCDGFRVGAVDQVARYASLLGADFCAAGSRLDLERAIAASNSDVIIVDTAGRGPDSRGGIEAALAKLTLPEAGATRQALLCVPASTRDIDARQAARFFAGCRPTGLVITKVDETPLPSGIVHAAAASELPIVALANGQRVPEDIEPASEEALMQYILRRPGARRPKELT